MTQTSPTAEQPGGEAAPGEQEGAERPVELRLARIHLRTGSYALARAELETAAGAGILDEEALLDLAEVRWRTDDLTGAGEAAAAYIASGREALLALVVAAEATAALGRPGRGPPARRSGARAGRRLDRRRVCRHAPQRRLADPAGRAGCGRPRSRPRRGLRRPLPEPGRVGAVRPGPWPCQWRAGVEAGRDGGDPLPDPAGELDAARAALAAGDRAGAALRLSIVLRLAPTLAPAVLDIATGESGPEFDLVRGDALRLVGRESQARRAFASAARTPSDEPRPGMRTRAPDRAAAAPVPIRDRRPEPNRLRLSCTRQAPPNHRIVSS